MRIAFGQEIGSSVLRDHGVVVSHKVSCVYLSCHLHQSTVSVDVSAILLPSSNPCFASLASESSLHIHLGHFDPSLDRCDISDQGTKDWTLSLQKYRTLHAWALISHLIVSFLIMNPLDLRSPLSYTYNQLLYGFCWFWSIPSLLCSQRYVHERFSVQLHQIKFHQQYSRLFSSLTLSLSRFFVRTADDDDGIYSS